MLHIVNKSPYERNALASCLGHAEAGSTILLIEDGVYAAIAGGRVAGDLKGTGNDIRVCALGPDLRARGVSEERLVEGVRVVDYGGFVDLVSDNERVQSWL